MKLNYYGYNSDGKCLVVGIGRKREKITAYCDFSTEIATITKCTIRNEEKINNFIKELNNIDFKLSPTQNIEFILNYSDEMRYKSYLFNYSIFNKIECSKHL